MSLVQTERTKKLDQVVLGLIREGTNVSSMIALAVSKRDDWQLYTAGWGRDKGQIKTISLTVNRAVQRLRKAGKIRLLRGRWILHIDSAY
jgi:hypothetical protein